MASGSVNDASSFRSGSCESDSDDPTTKSTKVKLEHLSDDGSDKSEETLMTSQVSEPKDLISLYTNVELGVVAMMDKRDEFLVTLAEAKRELAKAEQMLARCRVKETKLLHRLQCIREEVADRRVTQADINVERAKTVQKRLCHNPRLVGSPVDIYGTLFKPSRSVAEEVGVA